MQETSGLLAMPCDDALSGSAVAAAILVPTLVVLLFVASLYCWQKRMCAWAQCCSSCHLPCLMLCADKMGIQYAPMRVARLRLSWDDPSPTYPQRSEVTAEVSVQLEQGTVADSESRLNPLNPKIEIVENARAETAEHVAAVGVDAPSELDATSIAERRAAGTKIVVKR